MRKLGPVIIACLALAGAAVSQSKPATCAPDSIPVTEFDRYQALGEKWIVLIVPTKLKKECLVALAGELHKSDPKARFELFDARGYELRQYINWASGGMKDRDPYPDAWMKKHTVASLQPMSDDKPCAIWSVLDRSGDTIATFERIDCWRH